MRKMMIPVLALCLIGIAPLAAQETNPEKGAPSPASSPTEGCTAIPDDGYDGSIGSMACVMVPGTAGEIESVTVDLGLNHSWVGDLTVKVQSPAGTITTLQSRADYAEPADDGTGCCGDSDDLVAGSPVAYDDTAATSAEAMGVAGGVICQDDGICSYFPFPDTGPGTNLGDFVGEDGDGTWMVCVGDSASGDAGEICSSNVNLTIVPNVPTVEVPTVNIVGLMALLAALAAAGLIFLRRR